MKTASPAAAWADPILGSLAWFAVVFGLGALLVAHLVGRLSCPGCTGAAA
jgi:hypothetical protein